MVFCLLRYIMLNDHGKHSCPYEYGFLIEFCLCKIAIPVLHKSLCEFIYTCMGIVIVIRLIVWIVYCKLC